MSDLPRQYSIADDDPIVKSTRRLSIRDVALHFMRSRLDGSSHPALNTRQTLQAVVPKGPDELGLTPFSDIASIRTKPLQVHGSLSRIVADLCRTQQQLENIYLDCTLAQNSLLKTIEASPLSISKDLDLGTGSQHSWEEVEKLLDRAADVLVEADGAYDQKASQGRMSRIRRAMRHFGENAQNAKFYIALLPSEDNYLSSLTGGLKFICAAAERIGKIRKSVADALEELPTILSEKGQLLELLDKRYTTEQLHRRNADFSAAVLHAIEAIIQWFGAKPGNKFGKALVKPATYEDAIIERIKTVRRRSKDFKTQADISYKSINLEVIGQLTAVTSRLYMEERQRGAEGANVANDISYIKEQQSDLLIGFVVPALHRILNFFDKDTPSQIPNASNKELLAVPNEAPKTRLRVQVKDILERYCFDTDRVLEDCETLLNLRWTMEEEEQDRAVALMQNESVREWIRTPESSALLVHGNGTNSVNSPASFVSAKLFESLCMESEDSSAIIPLAFFCGLHTDKGSDFDTYPSGLALNFLLQLVEHKVLRDHDAESTRLAALTSNVDVNEVTSWSMLELLVHVVQQLPPDLVVFFIVDAVNYYEESSRLDETMEFVDGMHELVEGQKGPVVKVLFTSPAGTIAIWETFRSRRGNGGPKVIRMNGSYSMQGGFKRLGWEEF